MIKLYLWELIDMLFGYCGWKIMDWLWKLALDTPVLEFCRFGLILIYREGKNVLLLWNWTSNATSKDKEKLYSFLCSHMNHSTLITTVHVDDNFMMLNIFGEYSTFLFFLIIIIIHSFIEDNVWFKYEENLTCHLFLFLLIFSWKFWKFKNFFGLKKIHRFLFVIFFYINPILIDESKLMIFVWEINVEFLFITL